jgi:hypothetical protein
MPNRLYIFFIKPHIALELSLAVNPTPVVKYLLVHKRRLEEAEVYEESMHKNKKEL